MFTLMAYGLGNNDRAVNRVLTEFNPSELAHYLDLLWRRPRHPVRDGILTDGNEQEHRRWGERLPTQVVGWLPPPPTLLPIKPYGAGFWHHLIYAYMLEQTRIVEIFQRVVYEYVHGERLPIPSEKMQRWIRATEELFFTSPRVASIRSPTSNLRPDAAAIRRNAYYRLLGLDLTHGANDGASYPYVKADASNREFARAFEQLLEEVWRGYANRKNQSGPNTTDDQAISELARNLRLMLTARRQSGNLSREEFDAVTTLSWFHLTVLNNSNEVVNSLRATSISPALRLKKIADLVGVPMHAKADSYFQMAEDISWILMFIENQVVERVPPAVLYNGIGLLSQAFQRVITHWSITTGRNIKGDSLRVGPGMAGIPGLAAPARGALAVASRLELTRM
jgi:hypothetical protein